MAARRVEVASLAVMALAVLVGGRTLLVEIATFGPLAVTLLAALALAVVVSFRREFRLGGPLARIHATRDTAFLAAIAGAIAFIVAPARWSLGATVVALEIGLVVALLTRLGPAP